MGNRQVKPCPPSLTSEQILDAIFPHELTGIIGAYYLPAIEVIVRKYENHFQVYLLWDMTTVANSTCFLRIMQNGVERIVSAYSPGYQIEKELREWNIQGCPRIGGHVESRYRKDDVLLLDEISHIATLLEKHWLCAKSLSKQVYTLVHTPSDAAAFCTSNTLLVSYLRHDRSQGSKLIQRYLQFQQKVARIEPKALLHRLRSLTDVQLTVYLHTWPEYLIKFQEIYWSKILWPRYRHLLLANLLSEHSLEVIDSYLVSDDTDVHAVNRIRDMQVLPYFNYTISSHLL